MYRKKTERYKQVLSASNAPLFSSDILQSSFASLVDLNMTRVVDGDLIRIMAWFDNEWGFLKKLFHNMSRYEQNKNIWTIGHSTRSLDEFIVMLKSFQIECVADIRSFPGSRKYPQFNKEALEISLPQNNIRYFHLKNLGGRRKAYPDSKNTAWRHVAFRGYADYMETDEFREAIQQLEKIAMQQRTAFMCSEAVWWRCHRSMVSDYLKVNGWTVMHIMGIGKDEEHPYTRPARIVGDKLVYSNE